MPFATKRHLTLFHFLLSSFMKGKFLVRFGFKNSIMIYSCLSDVNDKVEILQFCRPQETNCLAYNYNDTLAPYRTHPSDVTCSRLDGVCHCCVRTFEQNLMSFAGENVLSEEFPECLRAKKSPMGLLVLPTSTYRQSICKDHIMNSEEMDRLSISLQLATSVVDLQQRTTVFGRPRIRTVSLSKLYLQCLFIVFVGIYLEFVTVRASLRQRKDDHQRCPPLEGGDLSSIQSEQ